MWLHNAVYLLVLFIIFVIIIITVQSTVPCLIAIPYFYAESFRGQITPQENKGRK